MRLARCWTVLLLGLFTLDDITVSAQTKGLSPDGEDMNGGRLGAVIHANSHKSQHDSNHLKKGVSDQLESLVVVSTNQADGQSRALHQRDAHRSNAHTVSGPEENGTASSLPSECIRQHVDGKDGKQCCGSKVNCLASSSRGRSRSSKRIVKG